MFRSVDNRRRREREGKGEREREREKEMERGEKEGHKGGRMVGRGKREERRRD